MLDQIFISSIKTTLLQLAGSRNHAPSDTLARLYQIFDCILNQLIAQKDLPIRSGFAKISFLAANYKITGTLLYLTHSFRRSISAMDEAEDLQAKIDIAFYVIVAWISTINGTEIENDMRSLYNPASIQRKKSSVRFEGNIEGMIVGIEASGKTVAFIPSDEPERTVDIDISSPVLQKLLHQVQRYLTLPVKVCLLNTQIKDHQWHPQNIIIDPDYLIDVTSVSEAFKANGVTALSIIPRKLLFSGTSKHLIIGNAANMVLDELIYNPDLSYDNILNKIFQLAPLAFVKMNDEEIRTILFEIKTHFYNIKTSIQKQFNNQGIEADKSYVEPSFYSSAYGLQGRLDLLSVDEEKGKAAIVELKSGKPYKVNSYGLNPNHYIQTILYQKMLQEDKRSDVSIMSFILYSATNERSIRYAPLVNQQFNEAVQARNQIRVLEAVFEDAVQCNALLEKQIDPKKLPKEWGFLRRDLSKIIGLYRKADPVLKQYVSHFIAMISKERTIAKTGVAHSDHNHGYAALWLRDNASKALDYTCLQFLEIKENLADQEEATIVFTYSAKTNKLTKLRKGDIVALKPGESSTSTLDRQIFKCSVLDISRHNVQVRLRARQENIAFFSRFSYWHLEPDLLDSSFNSAYRSLFSLLESPKKFQTLILGLQKPTFSKSLEDDSSVSNLKASQVSIVQKAVTAEDYYLIWGPPGTGKTKMILTEIVKKLWRKERIILVSYTNRAVDEMCAALLEMDAELSDKILRIGSRYSCGETFLPFLFGELTKSAKNRSQLVQVVEDRPVVISTVASLHSKMELLDLHNYETMIIDEASQILEPPLLKMVSKVNRFIMIGDHKQLPAVTTLSEPELSVNNKELTALGLQSLGDSLFERLLQNARNKAWDEVIGMLDEQGRMHQDIMQFVNHRFYEGRLKVLDGVPRLQAKRDWIHEGTIEKNLADQRMLFFPVSDEGIDLTQKGSRAEAKACVELLEKLSKLLAKNGITITDWSIGVITPYRLQIAYILEALEQRGLEGLDVQVDTVERFQGGAKDLVLYSTAVNNAYHLRQLTANQKNGVDRKLNVAITRAKEQFIMLGNEKVLEKDKLYGELIRSIHIRNFS